MAKVFVSTELGGGGTSSPKTVEIAKHGVHNLLVHAGILRDEPIQSGEPMLELEMQQDNAYVFSKHNGLLEPCVSLGDPVQNGDLIARIYSTERTGMPPIDYFTGSDGIIMGRHYPSLVKIGDCMNVIANISKD